MRVGVFMSLKATPPPNFVIIACHVSTFAPFMHLILWREIFRPAYPMQRSQVPPS
jgi:hypothetical protein